jgi:hypothetical protein
MFVKELVLTLALVERALASWFSRALGDDEATNNLQD